MSLLSSTLSAFHFGSFNKEILWSFFVLILAFTTGQIQFRRIQRSDRTFEQKRQSRAYFRNGLMILTVGSFCFIWGGELRALLLSVAAIFASLMIVSKEIISCLYGGFIFTFSKPARIGDFVTISTHQGLLIDHNLLNFTLLSTDESQRLTGQKITLPNSLLLTTPFMAAPQSEAFRFLTLPFIVPVEYASSASQFLLHEAQHLCRPWLEEARTHQQQLNDTRLVNHPSVDPSLVFLPLNDSSVTLHLHCCVPLQQVTDFSSTLSSTYFKHLESYLKTPDAQRASFFQPLDL